jgi:hypothetical protein
VIILEDHERNGYYLDRRSEILRRGQIPKPLKGLAKKPHLKFVTYEGIQNGSVWTPAQVRGVIVKTVTIAD